MPEPLEQKPSPVDERRLNVGDMRYSLRRYYVDEFHQRHVPNLPKDSRIIDLGGNRIRKRGQFDIECYDFNVIYANLSIEKYPDVQADGANLPFDSLSFDAAICSELLEHVLDPIAILREVYRVLRPGGTLLICVPFLYRIHADPYDFGRYTDYFWEYILREVGFENVTIERQGLFFSVLVDFLQQYLIEVGFRRPFGQLPRLGVSQLKRWALRHEQRLSMQTHTFLRSFTTGFGIVAEKKVHENPT